jgi:hypothetical protein
LAGVFAIFFLSTVTDLAMHASGVFPPEGQPMATALWLLASGYRIVYDTAGCYLAARLAPSRPMTHALVLGGIGVVLSLLGTVATWNKGLGFGPHWYPLSLVATSLPCAWVGGKLRVMQTARGRAA